MRLTPKTLDGPQTRSICLVDPEIKHRCRVNTTATATDRLWRCRLFRYVGIDRHVLIFHHPLASLNFFGKVGRPIGGNAVFYLRNYNLEVSDGVKQKDLGLLRVRWQTPWWGKPSGSRKEQETKRLIKIRKWDDEFLTESSFIDCSRLSPGLPRRLFLCLEATATDRFWRCRLFDHLPWSASLPLHSTTWFSHQPRPWCWGLKNLFFLSCD